MNQDWLKVAQVYATLSAGYRQATEVRLQDGGLGYKGLEKKANEYETLAQTALMAAGVQG